MLATLVSLHVGEKQFGISPGEGEVSFTLRAARQEALKALEGKVCAFAEELCREQGFGLEFSVQDEFPDTVNAPEVFEKCRKRLRESGISWERLEAPMRWSEDFGWYLKKIPGCFLGIGAGERHPGLHTDSYEFPDALIEPAVSVLKAIVGLNC